MLRFVLGCASVCALSSSAPLAAAYGDLDPLFGSAGVAVVASDDAIARSIWPHEGLELPDGKLLFAGERAKVVPPAPWYEPQIRGMLVRLNADGTPDATFGNTGIAGLVELPDIVSGRRMQGIASVARFADGSLVAVGTGQVNGPIQGYLVKLTADGDVDETFGDTGHVLFPLAHLHAVRIDGAGRVVVAGETFDTTNFAYTAFVTRLDPGGGLDSTFGNEGSVVFAGADPTASGYLNDLALAPDDSIVAGGAFESNGSGLGSEFSLVRLTASGDLDATFAGGGWRVFNDASGTSISNGIEHLVLLADGSIAFAGFHTSGENHTGPVIGRVAGDGHTDATFGEAATPGFLQPDILADDAETANATALVAHADGSLVASFGYYSGTDKERFLAVGTTAAGTLDPAFAVGGVFDLDLAPDGPYSEIGTLVLQADGRLVAAGRSQPSSEESLVDFAAVRLLGPASDAIFANGFD